MQLTPIRFSAITINDIQPGVKLIKEDTGHTFVPTQSGEEALNMPENPYESRVFGPLLEVSGHFTDGSTGDTNTLTEFRLGPEGKGSDKSWSVVA